MKNPFQRNKFYCTSLTSADIKDYVSALLSRDLGIFTKPTFTGNVTLEGFDIVVFKKTFFQTRVVAKILRDSPSTTVNIKFRPTINPLFLLIPIWTFFLYSFFASSFTINGEETSLLSKSLFILLGLAIFTLLILVAVNSSIQLTQKKIETDLKLKNSVQRPGSLRFQKPTNAKPQTVSCKGLDIEQNRQHSVNK